MTKTLRKEAFYPHPPEAVWTAITDPHALAEWLMPNTFKAEVGHRFGFQVDGGVCGHRSDGEVKVVEPPRKLVYTMQDVAKPGKRQRGATTVTWLIEPAEGGSRLTLIHEGLENLPVMHRLMLRMGWGHMLKRLIPRVLGNVEGGAFRPGAIPLEKRCYKCRTVPAEFVR
jgi:uncharacterized protein YndB with AHSA1/START domain